MDIWGGNGGIDTAVSLAGMDCWVYARPYRAAVPAAGVADRNADSAADLGGDIHFVTSCATGRITRFLVADVSGHGAPVAKMAAALRGLMRKHSNHYDQRRFVESVNRRFGDLAGGAERAGEGPDESTADAAVFATGVFGSYYAPSDELSICNAGHPRPLRYDASRGTWSAIETESDSGSRMVPANLPLGVLEDTRYDLARVKLGPGDLVLFYSDSLIEARAPAIEKEPSSSASGGRARSRLLGEGGVLQVLNGLDPNNADGLIKGLLRGVESFALGGSPKISSEAGVACDRGRVAGPGGASAPFDDDVTVLLVRRNDRKPRASIGLSVRATATMLRENLRSLARGDVPMSWPDLSPRAVLGPLLPGLDRRG